MKVITLVALWVWILENDDITVQPKNSSAPLMRHDLSDLRSLILIKITPTERTLSSYYGRSSWIFGRSNYKVVAKEQERIIDQEEKWWIRQIWGYHTSFPGTPVSLQNDKIGQMDNRNQARWVYFLYFIQKRNLSFRCAFFYPWLFYQCTTSHTLSGHVPLDTRT